MAKKRGGQMFDRQILTLIITVFSVGIIVGFLFGKRSVQLASRPIRQAPKQATAPVPVKEVTQTVQQPVSTEPTFAERAVSWFPIFRKQSPRIAIVIDDVGNDKRLSELLWSFDQPVTLAILPQLAYSSYYATEGKARGFEIILHQPMQPIHDYDTEDPGMIKAAMSEWQITDILAKDLKNVHTAEGVNNHKGSLVTQDEGVMRTILGELKNRNLFFLDSMTIPSSVGKRIARELGVPCIERDVFLDNDLEMDHIHLQIEALAQIARKKGFAVGIGHYKNNTLLVLKDEIRRLKEQGFELVPLKKLVQ